MEALESDLGDAVAATAATASALLVSSVEKSSNGPYRASASWRGLKRQCRSPISSRHRSVGERFGPGGARSGGAIRWRCRLGR